MRRIVFYLFMKKNLLWQPTELPLPPTNGAANSAFLVWKLVNFLFKNKSENQSEGVGTNVSL